MGRVRFAARGDGLWKSAASAAEFPDFVPAPRIRVVEVPSPGVDWGDATIGAAVAGGARLPRLMSTATYAVGREKVREYAYAVGETDPRYLDPEKAREAGFADVVAPPMFAAVYAGPAVFPAIMESGLDFSRMVHGAQEFTWHEPVVAGDEITTEAELEETSERGGLQFYVFKSTSRNQRGELVSEGRWTNIVR